MGDGHGGHEVVLKCRLEGSFDLFDVVHYLGDRLAGRAREQGDGRPGAGCVANAGHPVWVAVGHQAQHGGPDGVDMATEGSGQTDLVDGFDVQMVHEQADPRVEGRLGQLDGANVVLGDEHPVAIEVQFGGVEQDVGEGATVRHDAVRGFRTCTRDHPVGVHEAGHPEFGYYFDDPRTTDAGHASG